MAELTFEKVLELFAESEKKYQEQRLESDKRLELQLQKITSELGRKIGDLGDTLGRFAEEQVKEDLVYKFDKWGIPVHALTTHFVKRDNKNEFLYEVDILIYNTEYVIAIEVKNQLKKDHVDEHLERMKKLQEYPLPDTRGKKLLAGVAGMIIAEGVDKYAVNKGLFVIKPSGDTVKISNDKRTFKPQEWKVN